jgi:hypothetical protein
MSKARPMQEAGAMIGPLRSAAAMPSKTSEVPLDHTREAPAIAMLARSGYTADFVAAGDDTLRVTGTNRLYAAHEARIRDYYRFEGTSDPDDMSVIYAVELDDGTRGTLIDAYGTYADPAVGLVVAQMRLEPLAA